MKKKILATVVAAGMVLSGCSDKKVNVPGGGGGDEETSAVALEGHVSGTAAVGAGLGLANVKITCNVGTAKIGKTDIYGVYSIDVSSSCTAPYHVKVSSSNGEVETIALNSGTIANVTPLTKIIASRAVGGSDLLTKFRTAVSADIEKAQNDIKAALKAYAVAVKASASPEAFLATDLMSGSFAANGKGIDKLLDLIKIQPDNGDFKISLGVTDVAVSVNSATEISAPTADQIIAAVAVANSESSTLEGIRAYTKNLTAAFKNGRPSEAVFNELMDADFLHHGKNRAKMYDDLDGSDVKGLQFRNVVILDSSEDNFWVAFQIFGFEDGAYSLWNTWTSKVDLEGNAGKGTLSGNRLPVALNPGFVRHNTISAQNVVTDSDVGLRVLEIGGYNYQGTIKLKKYNDVGIVGGEVSTIDGLVQPGPGIIHNLSSDFIKIDSTEALKSISKITFEEGNNGDQESYIYIPQVGEENVGNYVTLTFPPFIAVDGDNTNCRYAKSSLPAFSDFVLSRNDFDLGGLEMNFKGYEPAGTGVESYPGFAAYSWDQLTKERFDSKITDYVSKDPSNDFLNIGKFDVSNVTVNDVSYHTIYSCIRTEN